MNNYKTVKQAQQKNSIEQSVDQYLVEIGVTFATQAAGSDLSRDGWLCDGWRAVFAKKAIRELFDFYTGIGRRAIPTFQYHSVLGFKGGAKSKALACLAAPFAPFAANVLHSLILDSSAQHQSFRDWCADYGQDSDSIKALNTYNSCCENAERLSRVFTREQLAHIETLLQDY